MRALAEAAPKAGNPGELAAAGLSLRCEQCGIQVTGPEWSAVMAAEDKRFFDHAGVDYRALPRVVQKTVVRSMGEWWKRVHGLRLLLPEGGSTLTQQLVRGYFLQDLTSRVDRDALFHVGLAPPRLLSVVLGAPATKAPSDPRGSPWR